MAFIRSAAAAVVVVLCTCGTRTQALDNGLGITPPSVPQQRGPVHELLKLGFNALHPTATAMPYNYLDHVERI